MRLNGLILIGSMLRETDVGRAAAVNLESGTNRVLCNIDVNCVCI